MGPEFFQTQMGQRFYTSTMPRIADALETIAKILSENQKTKPLTNRDPNEDDDLGAQLLDH